jgi:hypothetical protein
MADGDRASGMADDDRAYIGKHHRVVAFPGYKRAGRAYIAEIVSLSDVGELERAVTTRSSIRRSISSGLSSGW